ncbi:hypothetical protein DUI87_22122 [Hirundo rustica rustica]|uniref:Uncharacterized protein n=1 Tax=Hirundo rustica rustica TaxID=333673 RepID=A0A3M0JK67_HIRRU|nr:hypothetical protein DUI87_22122 [Hirundo rustica rustica]
MEKLEARIRNRDTVGWIREHEMVEKHRENLESVYDGEEHGRFMEKLEARIRNRDTVGWIREHKMVEKHRENLE